VLTLLLGGARSGKSLRAEAIGSAYAGEVTYVATASELEGDAEWSARIEAHRKRRPHHWRTLEVPLALAACLHAEAGRAQHLILVDCLSVWLSNCLLAERDLEAETEALLGSIRCANADVILVSSEVGFGVVPPTALGRRFRDAQGRLNQGVAALADRVELWVAGLPLVLKPAGRPASASDS